MEKPLIASMAPLETPIRVYFFERPDGTKIHVSDKAAWQLYSRPQQTIWGNVRFKYLGTSNGRVYSNAVQEANLLFKEGGLEAAQAHLRKAWDLELEASLVDKTPPPNYDRVDKTGAPVNMSII